MKPHGSQNRALWHNLTGKGMEVLDSRLSRAADTMTVLPNEPISTKQQPHSTRKDIPAHTAPGILTIAGVYSCSQSQAHRQHQEAPVGTVLKS